MKIKIYITVLFIVIILAACSTSFTPIPTSIPLDSNKDGRITPEELKVTFLKMHEIVKEIAKEQPSVAAKLEAEITSYENANPLMMDIYTISITAKEILSAAKAINEEQAAKDQAANDMMMVILIFTMTAVILLLAVFFLVWRRKSRAPVQELNTKTVQINAPEIKQVPQKPLIPNKRIEHTKGGNRIKCSHCNQEHPNDTRFCPITGKKIILPDICPQCGKEVDPNWLHCGYCGGKLSHIE